MSTSAAHCHAALERKDVWDSLTSVADLAIMASKEAKALEAIIAEQRLVLAMAEDVMRKGTWHHSVQQQVAGVMRQIRETRKL
jgi:hypothetical protein